VLTPAQVGALAGAAAEFGDGAWELTSRANVQVRGLEQGQEPAFAGRLAEAGLLPSPTHERVRNVIASPHAGCDDRGLIDVRSIVGELDETLCARAELAALPGRFLFTVDDGRGDVVALGADVGLVALDHDVVALVLAGEDSGLRVRPGTAARTALAAADAFLTERAEQDSQVWRITELAQGAQRVTARVRGSLGEVAWQGQTASIPESPPPTHAQVGPVRRGEGTVTFAIGAPLGRLSADQVDIITAASEASGGLRLTPWRTVILPALPEDDVEAWTADLDACGLVVDPMSTKTGTTACTGRPGCAKSLADVRADAERAMRNPRTRTAADLPVHWVGCARRCGRPQGRVVEVLATEAGYEVGIGGGPRTFAADVDEVSAALDAARRTV
jgi:precorrin-3B synthase